MWHKLKQVASDHYLNAAELERFAIRRAEMYGLISERGLLLVNTMNVGRILKDFKSALEHCQRMLHEGDRVGAVKYYREAMGCGLPDALRSLGLRE